AGFASVVSGAGGRVTPAAVKQVSPGHEACATWTAEAWARQAADRGGGGVALDLPAIQALAAKGLEAPGTRGDAAQSQATLGLALALTPGPLLRADGRDERERARKALQAAIDLAPARPLPRVDLAQFVLLPSGQSEAARRLLEGVLAQPVALDAPPGDGWARQRAASLLGSM
ncbi:MAG: hypothetical protein VX000_17790, partial [Myxococcota bacterium]|nr:hypothetical protein [Myxococcota bacterium]